VVGDDGPGRPGRSIAPPLQRRPDLIKHLLFSHGDETRFGCLWRLNIRKIAFNSKN
jgi:hypothetical protein